MAKSDVKFSDNFMKGYIHKDNVKEVKAEMSRLASVANKRLQRLEKAGLENSPTYKKWVNEGSNKFGVRGKNHNQLQAELARLKAFLNAKTSTIRGINTVLKDMANTTGIKYKNLKDLRAKADTFFELKSKTEQYLRNVDDIASAFTSTRLFNEINQYVADAKIDLSDSNVNIEDIVANVTDMLKATNNQPINGWSNDPDGWWFD